MTVKPPTRFFSLAYLALMASAAILGCCEALAQGSPAPTDGMFGEAGSKMSGLANVTAHGTTSFASSTAPVTNETNGWADVPRLFVGADAAAGDALEVTVTADVETTGSVWFRAVVDDRVALPSDVLFFRAGRASRGTRSFTFVLPNATAGYHLVRIQSSGRGSKVRTRSIAVRAASPSTTLAKLAFVVPTSGPSIWKTSAGWANIPDLSYPITTTLKSEVEATISAEVGVSAGRMLLRVLVDGAPAQPGDITLLQEGVSSGGSRSVSFRLKDVPAGTHWITAQWYSDAGGRVWIGDRTLTAFASTAVSPAGGAGSAAWETAPIALSSSWGGSIYANVYGGSDPGAIIRAMVTAEVQRTGGSGAIYVRAIVDGVVAEPAEVRFDPESKLTAGSFVFARRGFPKGGNHAVELQFRADSGTSAVVRDRALVATGMRRLGGDFVRAEPHANRIQQRQGTFDLLTICFDPLRPAHPLFTEAQLRSVIDGRDGMASVQGLISQTTLGRLRLGSHRVVGCDAANRYIAPVGHQGNWYWDNNEFGQMRLDALVAADPDVDFHTYDRNRDNRITPDELIVQICQPQDSPYGTAGRWVTASLDGGTPLDIEIVDCYMSTQSERRAEQAGVLAHEYFHELIGAYDLYGKFPSINANAYSLMANHGLGSHLDPYHKIHSGWLKPILASIDTWTEQAVQLPAVESSGEAFVIYRPSRNDREYFILENRFTGALPEGPNYDGLLPKSGIAVWHVIEDNAVAAIPPPGVDSIAYRNAYDQNGWPVGGVRFRGVLHFGRVRALTWADGTAVGITLTALDDGANPATIRVARPLVVEPSVSVDSPSVVLTD